MTWLAHAAQQTHPPHSLGTILTMLAATLVSFVAVLAAVVAAVSGASDRCRRDFVPIGCGFVVALGGAAGITGILAWIDPYH